MNYTQEVNAFYDWLETNSIAVSSIAVWHALMHICNKTGWLPEFTVAVSVLCVKTGLERRTIYNARNELSQKGRITFKERKGNQSAMYSINWFYDYSEEICSTKNAHSITYNPSHNLTRNPSHNLTPLDLDLNRSKDLKRSTLALSKSRNKKDSVGVSTNPPSPSPVTTLLKQYKELFKAKCNNEEPVINWGKDSKLIHDLLQVYKDQRLSQLLIDFFASEDEFVTKNGYTIGIFRSQINTLLMARVKAEKEIEDTYGDIDPNEYPGGPDCKCGGKGWWPELRPDPKNGIERMQIITCPCKKLHANNKDQPVSAT